MRMPLFDRHNAVEPEAQQAQPGHPPPPATAHFFVTPRARAALEAQEAELPPGQSLCLAYLSKPAPEGPTTAIYELPNPDLQNVAIPAVCEGCRAFVDVTLAAEAPAIVVDYTIAEGYTDVAIPPHTTTATNPAKIRLSFERLLRFHPDFFDPKPDFDPLEQSAILAMRLLYGDARAAMVLTVRPNVIVAAYSDDLDAVALLRFSPRHADEHRLTVGSRLVTVNTYTPGQRLAPDLHLGPEPKSAAFSNFHSCIADLLSEDQQRLAELHASIPPQEWEHCWALGEAALAARAPTRSGRPLRAGVPGRRSRSSRAPLE